LSYVVSKVGHLLLAKKDGGFTKGGHGLDFPKSNLDPIQIEINGLDLKSISSLTRSNIFGFLLNPFKVD